MKLKLSAKRFFAIVLMMALAAGMLPLSAKEAKAASGTMNIYGIYLDTTEKGDSVLIESDGEYLLMDLGMYANMPSIVKELNTLGVTHLDLYFSHLHPDHIGGTNTESVIGLEYLYDKGIVIDHLYLPDPSLAPESTGYPEKYQLFRNFMNEKMGGSNRIIYLKGGSTFSVGSAYASVLGPDMGFVGGHHVKAYSDTPAPETYYENNVSLITKVSCGNISFLTTGDMLSAESDYMVKKNASRLKADILKLPHHGTGSGTTVSFVQAVDPVYCFAINNSYTGIEDGQWRFSASSTRAKKFCLPYYVASENQGIIYQVQDGTMQLYRGASINSANKVDGWLEVYGADDIAQLKDCYYIGADGLPLTGVQKIGSEYYYFDENGCMIYGMYESNGSYNGWRTFDEETLRYFVKKSGSYHTPMATGVTKVESDYYYFDANGITDEGSGKSELKNLDGKSYVMNADGMLLHDVSWTSDLGETYYLGSNGVVVTNQFQKRQGKYYFFGSDGKMLTTAQMLNHNGMDYLLESDGNRAERGIHKLNGKTYITDDNGNLLKSQFVKLDNAYYYAGKYGTMVAGKNVKIKGTEYFFEANGTRAEEGFHERNGKIYYTDELGRIQKSKLVEYRGYTFYVGKKGGMVTSKKVKIKGVAHYFGEDGVMYVSRIETIGAKNYSFDENGVMTVYKGVMPPKTADGQ